MLPIAKNEGGRFEFFGSYEYTTHPLLHKRRQCAGGNPKGWGIKAARHFTAGVEPCQQELWDVFSHKCSHQCMFQKPTAAAEVCDLLVLYRNKFQKERSREVRGRN